MMLGGTEKVLVFHRLFPRLSQRGIRVLLLYLRMGIGGIVFMKFNLVAFRNFP